MKIIIIGGKSDIGLNLSERFSGEGHEVLTWSRGEPWCAWEYVNWDLSIITLGSMVPIKKFFDHKDSQYTGYIEWEQAFMNNLFYPLRLLREIYHSRNKGSTVVFFGGPNPNMTTLNYSAYTVSKIALTKLVECLDLEEDTKFLILGPGKVKTKIQNQTLEARESAGENYQKVKDFMKSGKGTSHDEIYEFVKTCISLPKEIVGGRNLSIRDHVSSDWKNFTRLGYNQFKLRRSE